MNEVKFEDFLIFVHSFDQKGTLIYWDRLTEIGQILAWCPVYPPVNPCIKLLFREN